MAHAVLINERRRLGHADVSLAAHRCFGIEPTTFRRFAAGHAAVFQGHDAYASTPV